jgi:hypothetical protein
MCNDKLDKINIITNILNDNSEIDRNKQKNTYTKTVTEQLFSILTTIL